MSNIVILHISKYICQLRVLKTLSGPDVPRFGSKGGIGSGDMSGKYIYAVYSVLYVV